VVTTEIVKTILMLYFIISDILSKNKVCTKSHYYLYRTLSSTLFLRW